MNLAATVGRPIASLDALRGHALALLGPRAPWLLRDRERRIAATGLVAIGVALALTFAAPMVLLAIGPLILGVPHLVADAEASCRLERQQHLSDLDWPLGREFLEKTFQENRRALTPRHLIMACRSEFDRLQAGPMPMPPPPPSDDEFSRVWERQRKKLLGKLQGIEFDVVMAIGLPWLAQVNNMPFVCAEGHDHLGDVSLVFQHNSSKSKPVGISFCNQQPRSLWRRLDRLLQQWQAAKGKSLGTLVVLRSSVEPTTDTAQNRLQTLQQAGACVIMVEGQQLAELAAFQWMLTKAHKGDLTRNGKPVEAVEYDAWAKTHLSEAVKEFLQMVLEQPTTHSGSPAVATNKRTRSAKVTK